MDCDSPAGRIAIAIRKPLALPGEFECTVPSQDTDIKFSIPSFISTLFIVDTECPGVPTDIPLILVIFISTLCSLQEIETVSDLLGIHPSKQVIVLDTITKICFSKYLTHLQPVYNVFSHHSQDSGPNYF